MVLTALSTLPGPFLSIDADDPLPESHFVDGSGPIFTMYADMAGEEDKKMADSWKADADGILVFVSIMMTPSMLL